MSRRGQHLSRLVLLLAALILPSESFALTHQTPASGSFFASEWKTCRNDPVNNSDPLGLEGGNVVSAYGLVGLEDGIYRNDFGYAQLARTEWDVQKRVAKDSAKVGAMISAGVLTAGASTEIMIAAGVARGSLTLCIGTGMAAGFGSDAALQGTSILLGDQEDFSSMELLFSTALGGGVGAGGKYLGDFVGFVGSKIKTPALVPTLRSAAGSSVDDFVTITHRGTPESIAMKVAAGRLPANPPRPNNAITRLLDHPRPAVWVSEGYPSSWNRLWSGMVGRNGSASVSFKVPSSQVQRPAGWLKRWFGRSQRVIERDVAIPSDARIISPGGDQ